MIVVQLRDLTNLTTLVIYGTEITDRGRQELLSAIPGLRIR